MDSDSTLTRRERIAFRIVSVIVALTRWPAISRTLWDWDEALFTLALRDYDVTVHHPHPPGFPLFIGIARHVPLDGFHALQCVTVIASLFVFPAMFFLARELGFDAKTSIGAGLMLAFFPNVWFFGGTAFSDVPSLVLALLACALLLRGRRSDTALIAGALVLGIAAGVRPQNLLIAFVPFLLALRARWRTAIAGGLILATIVIASYAAAAYFSGGWDGYRDTLARHEQYIRANDSFLSPKHPGLLQVADDFFVSPYRAPLLNVLVTLFAIAGLVRLRKRAMLALLIFGPFLLFAWLYLDFHSASRFSIAYMPLFALLVAGALSLRGSVVIAIVMMVWTFPALRIAHTTDSPPVAAIESIRATYGPETTIYVDERLAAHAAVLLPDSYASRVVRVTPPLVEDAHAVLLREGISTMPGARNFTRSRDRLDGIARKRYFEVSVIPMRRPSS